LRLIPSQGKDRAVEKIDPGAPIVRRGGHDSDRSTSDRREEWLSSLTRLCRLHCNAVCLSTPSRLSKRASSARSRGYCRA